MMDLHRRRNDEDVSNETDNNEEVAHVLTSHEHMQLVKRVFALKMEFVSEDADAKIIINKLKEVEDVAILDHVYMVARYAKNGAQTIETIRSSPIHIFKI